jgi:hypothetical protein
MTRPAGVPCGALAALSGALAVLSGVGAVLSGVGAVADEGATTGVGSAARDEVDDVAEQPVKVTAIVDARTAEHTRSRPPGRVLGGDEPWGGVAN